MSISHKHVLISLVLLISFTAIIFFLTKPSFTETSQIGNEAAMPHNFAPELETLLTTLKEINLRMDSLENKQQKMALKINHTPQIPNQSSNSISNDQIDIAEPELDPESGQSPEEMKQQKIDEMSGYFGAEEYDTDWTLKTQEVVTQSLERLALHNSQLNSLDCRSSLCRMELSHNDNQSREILGGQVSMLLDYPTDGIIYSVDNGTDTPDTVVYFTREGQELPDLVNY